MTTVMRNKVKGDSKLAMPKVTSSTPMTILDMDS
jgi:hypothetical protein